MTPEESSRIADLVKELLDTYVERARTEEREAIIRWSLANVFEGSAPGWEAAIRSGEHLRGKKA